MQNTTIKSAQAPLNRSFAGAMMSGMLTDAIFKGIQGTPDGTKFDIVDSSLSAFQSGVSYISYQAAVELLCTMNKKFKEIKDDPKNRSQAVVYIAGGSLAATIATGINYPIECFREYRNFELKNGQKDKSQMPVIKISFKDAGKWFSDRVFGYIGFATSMGNIIPHLSPPRSSIHKWYQTQFLIQMSHFNGILTAYPYQFLRYNVSFVPYIKNYLKSVGRKMVSSDLSSYFKREMSGIPYMAI